MRYTLGLLSLLAIPATVALADDLPDDLSHNDLIGYLDHGTSEAPRDADESVVRHALDGLEKLADRRAAEPIREAARSVTDDDLHGDLPGPRRGQRQLQRHR